ncbi:hypothetical protein GN958_ATG20436 [Phytophthora infestans]|uniref:Uncharacterized protein n=1 Tax=Phytophthora infestans TaxID=4787 RepID=A0A8S9TPA8_PHYIN|nr:hypothetical protein GN958_ATG20436 [Phytophthora infestans]
MDRRQTAGASKKRPSEEAYSDGSENDGTDVSWEDDSIVSNSSSAATWSVEHSCICDTPDERTSGGASVDGCIEGCA